MSPHFCDDEEAAPPGGRRPHAQGEICPARVPRPRRPALRGSRRRRSRHAQVAPHLSRAGLPHQRVARAETETAAVIGPLDPARTTHDGKRQRTYAEIMTGDLNMLRLEPVVDPAVIAAHWAAAPPRLFQAAAGADTLAAYVRAGLAAAGLPPAADTALAASLDGLRRLVGRCIPLFGRINKRVDRAGSTRFSNYDPSANENFKRFASGTPHATCLNPTILSLYSDVRRDQGRVLCLVLPLARQGFNFPDGDERRVSIAGLAPAFLDCATVALVLHVYDESFDWNAWAPSARGGGDPFAWGAYRDANPGAAVAGFGLHRQIQGFARALVGPDRCGLTIADAREVMDRLRGAGALPRVLRDTPMTVSALPAADREHGKSGRPRAGEAHVTQVELRRRERKAAPSGLDVRTFMLIEKLLTGTPLEPLLSGGRAAFEMHERDASSLLACLRPAGGV